jgi:hypothetical protein
MTDREHMSFKFDLWNYQDVVRNADDILARVENHTMPTPDSGGPWPDEWIQLFRRWKDTGFKQLELGTAQYTFTQTSTRTTVQATGTFPKAGYGGWLQLETETDASKTYVLYFEFPVDDPGSQDFTIRERYKASDARSVFIRDSTGVQQIH